MLVQKRKMGILKDVVAGFWRRLLYQMLYALMINGNMIRTINGRDVNTTPSSKEKVASKVSSEESKSFIVNKDQTIDDLVVEKENEHKEEVNEYLSNLDNYNKQLTDYSKDINLDTLEMKPLYEGIVISLLQLILFNE